jgi:hypothetical protein
MPSTTKQLIDARLQRIANVLLLNASFSDNLGLLNGKMGIAIFFYHYAKYTGDGIYINYADELVDEIYEEIDLSTPVDFANGLAGIGWGIEYLAQNRFVEAETDEALADMDNRIYQHMINSPILLEREDDIFGYGLYYLARLRTREKDEENITTIIFKTIVIHLVDECERIFVHNRFLEYNISSIAIKPLISVLYFLTEVDRLGIFPYKVQKCSQYMTPYIEHAIRGADVEDKKVLCKLSDRFRQQANKEISGILKTSKELVMASIHKTEEEVSNVIFTPKWFNMALPSELTGLTVIGSDFSKAFGLVDNEEHWIQQLDGLSKENLGLTGMAGVGWWLLNKAVSIVNSKLNVEAL